MIDKMDLTTDVFPFNAKEGTVIKFHGHVFYYDGRIWIDCGTWN